MTRITTPFGFSSTADEVARGIDLSGRRAIITGATSGIGIETARTLAATGAQVTLAVRNTAAGDATAADITATTGNKGIHVARLDVSDRTSVDAFVQAWEGPLHILVNNAGIMATPKLERTPEGWEMQFATNYLGHFALTTGLYDALAADGNARIVVVSSSGHLISPVVFDDINFRYRPYDPLVAYGQSKTATVLFAVEATRRWAADSITANALMPGAIATNLQLEGIGGRYFEDCNEAIPVSDSNGWASGIAPYALDTANAERLWDESLHRGGLPGPQPHPDGRPCRGLPDDLYG
jgi:NAD(P)-dependent dehydrogenase (short-subunit alcohol dehydrogenase family)